MYAESVWWPLAAGGIGNGSRHGPTMVSTAGARSLPLPTRCNDLTTRLDGLVLLAPAVHGDARGFFVETFRADAWARRRASRRSSSRTTTRARAAGTLRGHPLPDASRPGQARARRARARARRRRRPAPRLAHVRRVGGRRARRRARAPAVDPGRLRPRVLRAAPRPRTSSTSARTTTTPATEAGIRFDDPDVGDRVAGGRRAALLRARPRRRRGWPTIADTLPFATTDEPRRPLRTQPDGRRCTSATCAPRCSPGCSRARPARAFLVRMEDLDHGPRAGRRRPSAQLRDLRGDRARLGRRGASSSPTATTPTRTRSSSCSRRPLYECFCTRAEIREPRLGAARAAARGRLPGHLPAADRGRAARASAPAAAPPALRVRAGGRAGRASPTACTGRRTGVVDDFVVRRNDGAPAYNLAVVVDDACAGDRRGRPRRRPARLHAAPALPRAGCSGCRAPTYAHVPLVLGAGRRAGWPSATAT